MNTKTLLTISALALGLCPAGLPTRADSPMSGMDMGGMKMTPKPMSQKPKPALLSVAATVNPAAPRTGDNALDLTILDAGGKPVMGLKLTATVAMTSMDMGTTHPAITETSGGHYTTKVNFGMNGPWRVVVRNGASKIAALDFEAGAKTPWKSPPVRASGIKSASAMPSKTNALAENPMSGMDMGGKATEPAAIPPSAPPAGAAKPMNQPTGDSGATSMDGVKMGGMTGSMGMKTATIPQLQETGTYTATGNEDWEKQTGFGHNAGMVAMMNQMMVGGSGMEGMKMPAMKMDFGEKNYAKPDADDSADSMPGMNMGGDKKAGQGGGMAGMNSTSPTTGGGTPSASMTVNITAATASTPKAGDNPLTIRITDAQGKPVAGATITTTVAMTSMDMGTTHPAVMEKGAGQYATVANFSMVGPWRVTVTVTAPGRKPQTKAFDFSAK